MAGPGLGFGGGYTDSETSNRNIYVGEGLVTDPKTGATSFYSPLQELMKAAWARIGQSGMNRNFLRGGFQLGNIGKTTPTRRGDYDFGWTGSPPRGGEGDPYAGQETPGITPREHFGDTPAGSGGGSTGGGGTSGGGGTGSGGSVPPRGGGGDTGGAGGGVRNPNGDVGMTQSVSGVGNDPYRRAGDATARGTSGGYPGANAPVTKPGPTYPSGNGQQAAWQGETPTGVGDYEPPKRDPLPPPNPWHGAPAFPREGNTGGPSGGGTDTGEDPRRTPATQTPGQPTGGVLPSVVPGWGNDPIVYGNGFGSGGSGTGASLGGGTGDYAPGGMSGYYLNELASKGYDPEVQAALTASTMAAPANAANTARRAMSRRVAATGNDAGYFGAASDLAENEAAATEQAARSNVMANATEQARRRAVGSQGLMDLSKMEQEDEQFWTKLLAGIGTKPRETTGESSGVNVNLGFGF